MHKKNAMSLPFFCLVGGVIEYCELFFFFFFRFFFKLNVCTQTDSIFSGLKITSYFFKKSIKLVLSKKNILWRFCHKPISINDNW